MISLSALLGFFTILFFRLVSVALGTARQIIVVRGYKYPGALLGFFEIFIYTLAISQVIRGGTLDQMFAYSLGFALGTIVGAMIEDRLALGYYSVRIITHDKANEIIQMLRSKGFGVTEIIGEGRDGIVYIIEVVTRRKDMPALQRYVRDIHERAFIAIGETYSVQRGFFTSESTR